MQHALGFASHRLIIAGLTFIFPAVCRAEPLSPTSVDGACTMAGLDDRAPNGDSFPVLLHIRGDDARGLGTGAVTVSHQDGSGTMTVDCDKPRVLLMLRPGHYMAQIDMAAGPTRNVAFTVLPSAARKTVEVLFPQDSDRLRTQHAGAASAPHSGAR